MEKGVRWRERGGGAMSGERMRERDMSEVREVEELSE